MPGSDLRLRCVDVIAPPRPERAIGVGDSCFIDGATQAERDAFCLRATMARSEAEGLNDRLLEQLPFAGRLFCEPTGLSCQIACERDGDCPAALRCVPLEVPATLEAPASSGACVDPLCPSFGLF